MSFDTDAISIWINGFFVLATMSGLLSLAALVLLLPVRRAGGPPVERTSTPMPVTPTEPAAAFDRAA